MADTKITSLQTPQVTTNPATDVLPIVNIADNSMATSGSTRKITVNQLLGAGGTATLASATITGDLTVDTSTLKVNSSSNQVGVGITTFTGTQSLQALTGLRISDANPEALNCLNFAVTSTTSTIETRYGTPLIFGTNATECYRISSSGVATWSNVGGVSGTAMTLNSTGLGIGVTPSATNSSYFQAIEIARIGQGLTGAKSALTSSPNSWLSNNSYATYSSGIVWNYAVSQPAAQYRLVDAAHHWLTAPSGTAGNAITFTQAMTLDASGNLLVGKSSAIATAVGIQFQPAGTSYHTLAASTNSDTTLLVYSTGASAYRFYVGMGGTVYATNTTISAISDARLKENVQDIDVGLGAILALKPRKFDWKAGKGKDIKGDRGFIAQEFEQVFPQLVDEWKDAAPEGEAPYKSVRQDLIPVLVKAIQELTARVQTLEAK